MYPDTQNTRPSWQTETPEKVFRRRLFLGIGLVVLVLVTVVVFFLMQPKLTEYQPTDTNLTKANFGYIDGSDVFAYNGLAFYKININKNKKTVLRSGERWPVPSKIFWAGTNGALLNFASSFSQTKVADEMAKRGMKVSFENHQTWYLDFKTGQLDLVSERPLVANLVFYSKASNGFYYTVDSSDKLGVVTPLYFYDIASKKVETISTDLQITDMLTIKTCPAEGEICFVGRDLFQSEQKKLYGIQRGQNKKTILEVAGQIIPTNNPALYVTIERREATNRQFSKSDNRRVEEVDISEDTAFVQDLKSNQRYKLDFMIGANLPDFHFVDSSKFLAVTTTPEETGATKGKYRSGILSSGGSRSAVFDYEDPRQVGTQFVVLNGSGGDFTLATNLQQKQVVVGPRTVLDVFVIKDSASAERNVRSCLSSSQSTQYTDDTRSFRVSSLDDSSFAQSVSTFSQCLAAKNDFLHGYNFEFVGIDPVNGRLSTD